jgi:hypothetical protein
MLLLDFTLKMEGKEAKLFSMYVLTLGIEGYLYGYCFAKITDFGLKKELVLKRDTKFN